METVAKLLIDRKKDIGNKDSYASSLFKDGLGKILEKIDEESKESIEASETGDKDKIVYEYTDLFFHMLVALTEHGLTIEDIYSELKRRFGKKKKDYTLDE
ncbi:phosphoribosyl-ATP diphosphatase [bacterium]|nr:phosphoribosyl-ATP diphosphatase [bacterium]